MDQISLQILQILQEKARIPNVEVARRIGMAPSAVLERIRKLEKQGLIDGYEVRLNPGRFNCGLIAFVFIQPETQAAVGDNGDAYARLPQVQEVHYVAGEDGYLLKVRVADTTALERLLRERIIPIGPVKAVRTHVVLSTAKETARIPLEVTPAESSGASAPNGK